MRIQWHGQGAFTLRGADRTVLIDPFDVTQKPERMSFRFDYPAIPQTRADLLLITHEHFDHNGAHVAAGSPHTVRSTAGRFETPLGEVIAIASEHDDEAGTRRGPNTIFVFALDGLRVCHMGDFGQAALRPEQRAAIGTIDVLFIPVGGGPTIDGAQAAGIVGELGPRWAVPMHYRTELVDFLNPPAEFLAGFESVVDAAPGEHELSAAGADGVQIVHPAVPVTALT
jgi:L-ascorbate metabolism protein UlaG (beta-lactamase superfamily)